MSHGQGTNHSLWRTSFRKHWNGKKRCLWKTSLYFWSGSFSTHENVHRQFLLQFLKNLKLILHLKEQNSIPRKFWKRKLSKTSRLYQLLKLDYDNKKLKTKGTFYLISWNCNHVNNAQKLVIVYPFKDDLCMLHGFRVWSHFLPSFSCLVSWNKAALLKKTHLVLEKQTLNACIKE